MRMCSGLAVAAALLPIACGAPGGSLNGFVGGVAGPVHRYDWRSDSWHVLDTADVVDYGDTVRVGDGGFLEVLLPSGTVVRFDENTMAHFGEVLDADDRRVLETVHHYGVVHSRVEGMAEAGMRYQVRTPEAVFEARGTEFTVTYELHVRQAEVDVGEGEVTVVSAVVSIDARPVVVPAGHFTVVPWGRPPPPPERIGLVRMRRLERLVRPSMAMRRPALAHARRPGRPGMRPGAPAAQRRPMAGRPVVGGKRTPGPRPAARPAPAGARRSTPAARPAAKVKHAKPGAAGRAGGSKVGPGGGAKRAPAVRPGGPARPASSSKRGSKAAGAPKDQKKKGKSKGKRP